MIGTALGTAVAGALLGPVLGALAAEVGTEPVFSAVLGDRRRARRSSPPACRRRAPPERQALREVAATIVSRPILTATAFVAVPSLMFGAIEVLVPLRIDDLGGGHVADRRRLHRRRRAGGGAGADRRPLLRPGRAPHAVRGRARDLRRGDGRRSPSPQTLGVGARRR